ncbi:hypothetical protein MKW98_008306 [Papaver atlanticum]|uniref:FBD domain-containing protein n=1 Tax=Papaver atlanticum TaxID=357466 RepID=A0AAD4XAP0_9MAGN|nr:hypothetical protein MKW98_008306 [Papaver atlanticum]
MKRLFIESSLYPKFDIQINAPNLQSFKYSPVLAKDFAPHNFSQLLDAEIVLSSSANIGERGELGLLTTKLFHSVSRVKRLTVSDHLLQSLPVFHNLVHLEVITADSYVGSDDEVLQCWIVEMLLKFLHISPNLESLIFVDGFCDYEAYPSYDWSLDLIPQCLLLHLKSIEFRGCFWNQAEKDLVRLFLKNAKALQTVRITISGQSSYFSKKSNYKKKVLNEIALFPRGSVDCVVHVS